MKLNHLLILVFLITGNAWADDEKPADEDAPDQEAVEQAQKTEEFKKPTGAARRELEDQIVAAMVEEYNEDVEEDLDEVVCKRERVTGQRTKVRICKTRRQIRADEAATERLLRQRTRASSGPAESAGMGAH